jgi:hypothetical protein
MDTNTENVAGVAAEEGPVVVDLEEALRGVAETETAGTAGEPPPVPQALPEEPVDDVVEPPRKKKKANGAAPETVGVAPAGPGPNEKPIERYWDETAVERIPHDHFIIDERLSGRKFARSADHAKSQKASIVSQGQIEPVAYRVAVEGEVFQDKWNGEVVTKGGELVLCAGFGRVQYIRELVEAGVDFPGGPMVRALLWQVRDSKEAFLRGLHGNLKRKGLSYIEIAHAINDLVHPSPESGEPPRSQREVADMLGITQGMVSQYLNVITALPDAALRMVHEGTITWKTALDLCHLKGKSLEGKVAELKTLAETKPGKKLVTGEARETLRKSLQKRKTKKGGVITAERSDTLVKEFMRGQVALAGNPKSSRAVVFGALLDFWAGKIDKAECTGKLLSAVPEWKRKQKSAGKNGSGKGKKGGVEK